MYKEEDDDDDKTQRYIGSSLGHGISWSSLVLDFTDFFHVNTNEPKTIILKTTGDIQSDPETHLKTLLRHRVMWWYGEDSEKNNDCTYEDVTARQDKDNSNVWYIEFVLFNSIRQTMKLLADAISNSQYSSDPANSPLQYEDGTPMNDAEKTRAKKWIQEHEMTRQYDLELLKEQYESKLRVIYEDYGKSKLVPGTAQLSTRRANESLHKLYPEYQNRLKRYASERMKKMLEYARAQEQESTQVQDPPSEITRAQKDTIRRLERAAKRAAKREAEHAKP